MAVASGEKQTTSLTLSQKTLVALIKDKFTYLSGARTDKNTQYAFSNAALSAFAVFFSANSKDVF
jgi:hypothetical protein